MIGLDLIGAGEGLGSQTIQIRVTKLDPVKLRAMAGEKWGGLIEPVLPIIDENPEMVLKGLFPVVKMELEKKGITADLSTVKTASAPRPGHEVRNMIGVGAVFGALVAFLGARMYYRRSKS